MAHELSFTDGRADMFSVIETPWHKLGAIVSEAPTFDEAVALARLDYEVDKRPVKIVLADDTMITSEKAFVTIRTDRNVELGSVGPDYTVVQNRDAFNATVRPLVERGLLKLETAGVLRNGADAWMLGRFDLSRFGELAREVFADEVLPYALVKVNHAGRRSNEVALTLIRVVCANTLQMVESEIEGSGRAISVRHTAEAQARMTEASVQLFEGLVGKCEVVAANYKRLKEFQLQSEQEFRRFIINPSIGVHPTKRKVWNPEARMAEAVIERWEKKAARIEWLWTNGMGHTGDHSAWEAYNGLVQAIDHDTELFPTRGGVYRTQGLMEGELRRMKDRTLSVLAQAAAERNN